MPKGSKSLVKLILQPRPIYSFEIRILSNMFPSNFAMYRKFFSIFASFASVYRSPSGAKKKPEQRLDSSQYTRKARRSSQKQQWSSNERHRQISNRENVC